MANSDNERETVDFPDNVNWSHFFEPPITPGYAEKSIVLSERKGLRGLLCGNTRILTDQGYCGWTSGNYLHKVPVNA